MSSIQSYESIQRQLPVQYTTLGLGLHVLHFGLASMPKLWPRFGLEDGEAKVEANILPRCRGRALRPNVYLILYST